MKRQRLWGHKEANKDELKSRLNGQGQDNRRERDLAKSGHVLGFFSPQIHTKEP